MKVREPSHSATVQCETYVPVRATRFGSDGSGAPPHSGQCERRHKYPRRRRKLYRQPAASDAKNARLFALWHQAKRRLSPYCSGRVDRDSTTAPSLSFRYCMLPGPSAHGRAQSRELGAGAKVCLLGSRDY